jgi:hypothetical protein
MSQHDEVLKSILELAIDYRTRLEGKINERKEEMKADDLSHHDLYSVLGVTSEKGHQIDIYQNIGRFLYKYAGSFLEEAAVICFKSRYPEADKVKIPNTIGQKPKTFEIDCLVGERAYEIKWRDATTDGDHITKEHTRVQNIRNAGYTPVRIMFYEPNRSQAQRIQIRLRKIYEDVSGEYYSDSAAWGYVLEKTGVDLKAILNEVATKVSFMEI